MTKICLVACAKSKTTTASRAEDLYVSRLFSYSRDYARSTADRWYILSAKYGLLAPDAVIEPYEETLNKASLAAQQSWATRVAASLRDIASAGDEVTLLAGTAYRRFLVPEIKRLGCSVLLPLEGMPIGVQVAWLKRALATPSPLRLLDRFYELLARLENGLGGKRELKSSTGSMNWPGRGVYFFFEPGESRSRTPSTQRVVRVGTHAVGEGSGSTLWSRLHTHRGGLDGHGHHRGSVFRLHVGAALLKRESHMSLPTWGRGSTAPSEIRATERDLERQVSQYIGAMSVLWLAVEDTPGPRSDRAYIERASIALLSRIGRQVDPPSEDWLGIHSPREAIRESGLWNVQWVHELPDVRLLDIFERYVDVTVGNASHPTRSIAPAGPWGDPQLALFCR